MASGITAEQVFRSADELIAEGKRPTIDLIRQRLGSGSPNTVLRHLNAWWERLHRRLEAGKTNQDMPQEVYDLATGLWQTATLAAMTRADLALKAERAELEAQAQQLRDARAQLDRDTAAQAEALSLLRAQIETQATVIASRDRQLQETQAALEQSERAGKTLLEDNARLQQAVREHEAAAALLKERMAANDRFQSAQLEAATDEAARAKAEGLAEAARLKQALAVSVESHESTIREREALSLRVKDLERSLEAALRVDRDLAETLRAHAGGTAAHRRLPRRAQARSRPR
ncbi:MAG: DNA-binding protein [Rhizobium sp.]|nr:MAG: DNA-binding protein [Rhizobium sp.]